MKKHPCLLCNFGKGSKDSEVCFRCDARIEAIKGNYIDPPKSLSDVWTHPAYELRLTEEYSGRGAGFYEFLSLYGYSSPGAMIREEYPKKTMPEICKKYHLSMRRLQTLMEKNGVKSIKTRSALTRPAVVANNLKVQNAVGYYGFADEGQMFKEFLKTMSKKEISELLDVGYNATCARIQRAIT